MTIPESEAHQPKKSFSRKATGAMLVLLGAIAFSSKAIFVKLAYRYPVDAISLLALRMLFSLPFFIGMAWFSQHKQKTSPKALDWIKMGGLGLLGYYVASFLDFSGLKYISASLERLVLFAYPTLVVILSAIFLGVPIKRPQYWALGFTYAGIIFALYGDLSIESMEQIVLGGSLVFGAAFMYAIYLIGSGSMIPKWGSIRFNANAMSIAAMGVLTHAFLNKKLEIFNLEQAVYFYSLAMALLSTVISSFAITAGIGRIGAGNAAIISSVGPVSTLVLAYWFLNEPIGFNQILGTGLVLIGILIIGSSK